MGLLRGKPIFLLACAITFILLATGNSYSDTKKVYKSYSALSTYDDLLYTTPSVLSPQNYFAVTSIATHAGPKLFPEVKHDTSLPLWAIPPLPPGKRVHKMPSHSKMPTSSSISNSGLQAMPLTLEPVLQTFMGPLVSTDDMLNFEGLGKDFPGFTVEGPPPDPNGAVGETQYVQWVNTSYAVFDKSGFLVYGPTAGNTIWALPPEFGGPCKTNNDGDPIVQYDKIANRWVMMQPVLFPADGVSYTICIAVSETSDARSNYHRYSYQTDEMPDYPKLGVWPDGYYITYSKLTGGNEACVLDRTNMLNGDSTAPMQCFPTTGMYILPSDLDGSTLPPPGSPNYLLESLFPYFDIRLWKFHADWETPANSTLTSDFIIQGGGLHSEPCSDSGSECCVPQGDYRIPLDVHKYKLMYRLAYRNFGNHEALVGNHSVKVGGSVGIRWYEIRNPRTTPTVYQQGTYAPDSAYRWLGSIAMDNSGNMALGYNVSSSSMYPAIRYTGRLATDPLGTLQGENSIKEGTAPTSMAIDLCRWGDYSSMSIDPVDDCTFWYTAEYSTMLTSWNTRIASFKFPGCGAIINIGVSTTPSARQVTVDNQNYTAPQTFDWIQGSNHFLSVASPQSGTAGTQYVFSSWSDGGAQTHTITTPSSNANYTANFTTQYKLTTAVSPSGAGSVSPDCPGGCWYNSGLPVAVSATPIGNYIFQSWSGDCSGTDSSTSVTMTAPKSCTANFVPATTITTSPTGKQIVVDSTSYTSPQTFYWPIGSNHSISVYSPQSGGAGMQYLFTTWSDGGAQTHTIATPSSPSIYTANFATQYQLTTSFAPGDGGVVSPSCSGTCWQNSGILQLAARPNSGYIFGSWSGDCSGTNPLTSINMNSPKSCSATFMTCGSQSVKNFETSILYNSIQSSYDDTINTSDGNTLRVIGTTSIEDLNLSRPISITLKGGYDCNFSGNTSYTFITGSLTIAAGAATVENLVIE